MIELKHVSFHYGGDNSSQDHRLRDINLTVEKGELILLSGPSGCGKTTILRLLNGLIPNYYTGDISGDILMDGESVLTIDFGKLAKKSGTVFQNPRSQFFSVDTTGELAFGSENQGIPEEEIYSRIDRTVSEFKIENLMDRNIFQISDGEKQKIACASVNVSDPSVILLDEPSANLDYEATLMLREVILHWKEEGRTVLIAEHRIAYIWDMIDRAVILQNGEIACVISTEEKLQFSSQNVENLGLRTTVMENPESIKMPVLLEKDSPITIRNLSCTYAGEKQPALDIPFLQIAEGEITAVIGSNGAGKTTYLNCVCGLEKNCRGTLEYEGKIYRRKERRKLCYMVMQNTGNQLFTDSVLEEVLISLEEGCDTEKATDFLKLVDMDGLADRHPQSLSGGQKQRLAIACALASGRKILLLDEPTSGLDFHHMQEIADALKKLRDAGTTILVVTHDSELIHACCGRILSIS